SVLALSDSEVLLFDYKRIITTCSSACVFHAKLIENMLKILADDVLNLNDKLHVLSNRTTRDKLLAYFELQREIFNSDIFSIPLNREQLADFLFVDRSAMSRELSNMRDEGLIKFDKNNIELLI
ncbi:MAG: helix-turn-helix domain-containing protein, partial [Eubacteriaceae bacterium]